MNLTLKFLGAYCLLAFGELPVLNAITGEQTCDVLTPSRASGYGLLE